MKLCFPFCSCYFPLLPHLLLLVIQMMTVQTTTALIFAIQSATINIATTAILVLNIRAQVLSVIQTLLQQPVQIKM